MGCNGQYYIKFSNGKYCYSIFDNDLINFVENHSVKTLSFHPYMPDTYFVLSEEGSYRWGGRKIHGKLRHILQYRRGIEFVRLGEKGNGKIIFYLLLFELFSLTFSFYFSFVNDFPYHLIFFPGNFFDFFVCFKNGYVDYKMGPDYHSYLPRRDIKDIVFGKSYAGELNYALRLTYD